MKVFKITSSRPPLLQHKWMLLKNMGRQLPTVRIAKTKFFIDPPAPTVEKK